METLHIAISALRRQKLRSFLTLLGVIIGVMTIVAVVAIISGLNNYVAEKIFSLNPDVFVVTRFGIITSREQFLEAMKRKPIELTDMQAIEERCQGCRTIGARTETQTFVKYGNERMPDVSVYGATANISQISNLDIEGGRFFTETEEHRSALVAVIGSDVRDRLFPRLDPVGRDVSVGGRRMRVIGLLAKQGAVLGESQDNQVFIPLSTHRKMFGSRRGIGIFVQPIGGVPALGEVQDEIRVIMRTRRHTDFRAEDPIAFVTAEAIQQVWRSISAGAFAVMILISGISLAVGGIVIMNIMLVSVVERTQEIGVRRAMGARAKDIQRQFLTEAVVLALVGGAIGALLGGGIAKAISMAFPLPTLVSPQLVIAGLAVAVVTGGVAGWFPSRRAAKMRPVEALRFET